MEPPGVLSPRTSRLKTLARKASVAGEQPVYVDDLDVPAVFWRKTRTRSKRAKEVVIVRRVVALTTITTGRRRAE